MLATFFGPLKVKIKHVFYVFYDTTFTLLRVYNASLILKKCVAIFLYKIKFAWKSGQHPLVDRWERQNYRRIRDEGSGELLSKQQLLTNTNAPAQGYRVTGMPLPILPPNLRLSGSTLRALGTGKDKVHFCDKYNNKYPRHAQGPIRARVKTHPKFHAQSFLRGVQETKGLCTRKNHDLKWENPP